ncbi:MAG: exosortase H-associated membrane protein [Thiolinea sp.]
MGRPLQRFMLGVLLILPLTFGVWYLTAAYHLAPVTLLAEKTLHLIVPGALQWLKLDGHILVVASNFGADTTGQILSPPPGPDLLGFHLNPLIYSYSLPLLLALILATPGQERGQKLLWGILLLLPTEWFSMVFSVMKTLTFDVGAAFPAAAGFDAALEWMLSP